MFYKICLSYFYIAASENTSPGKGDKPAAAEVPKSEQLASDEQPSAQAPGKQFAAYPLPYFGQPQFLPYQHAVYDPVKLNAANNGAVSSFLFPRSQHPSGVFQQPQPVMEYNIIIIMSKRVRLIQKND